jgi:hypothetical protein
VDIMPDTLSMDSQSFAFDTILEYLNRQDPRLAQDLAIHAGGAIMEFAI